jgi:microcystin-dependent protein
MSEPYLGEIKIFAGNFEIIGWHFCDGSLLSISENSALFNLLGTTYGGDGVQTFALPDLRGRVPIHQGTDQAGNTSVIGQRAGNESVTLTTAQMPAHTHPLNVETTTPGNQPSPANDLLAEPSAYTMFKAGNATVAMGANSVTSAGGSQPHDNVQPYLCINYIIALQGIYPTQN